VTNSQKILLAIFFLTESEKQFIEFENVVVKSFELFPDSFSLQGYPNFPNSETVSKRIYTNLKPDGLISVHGRKISLTPLGTQVAEKLGLGFNTKENSISKSKDSVVLLRAEHFEFERIVNNKGFKLSLKDSSAKLLDIDVYEFYGIGARSPKKEIDFRVNYITSIIKKVKKQKLKFAQQIINYKMQIDKILEDLQNEGYSNKNSN